MYKRGDKVVCIDTHGIRVDKIYLYETYIIAGVFNITRGEKCYTFKNNDGTYFESHFISELEYRRLKILKLKDEIKANKVSKTLS